MDGLSLAAPAAVDLWLVLGYAVIVVIAARIVERSARQHFRHAQRRDQEGFAYDERTDHYRCAGGQRLALIRIDRASRHAIYVARASDCSVCHLQSSCTPQGGARQLFRSLAAWEETAVGVFHQHISTVMHVAGALLCGVGLWRWWRHPGAGYLLVVLLATAWSLRSRWTR